MSDNTQAELDEILNSGIENIQEGVAFALRSGQNIDYHTFDARAQMQDAITAYTNKQIESVLDRLEKDFTRGIEKGRTVSFLATLRAERNKLKESTNDKNS